MNKATKTNRAAADQKLETGVPKHLGESGSLTLGGTKYTGTQLADMAHARNESLRAVESAQAEWKRLLREDAELVAKTDPILFLARQTLLALYFGQDAVLADLGISPRKPARALTSEEKAAKAKKMSDTRKARMTLGSRQKAKIKGAPAESPSPSPSPAPSATPIPAMTNGTPH